MIATAMAVAFVVYSCKGKLGEAEQLDLEDTPTQVVNDMFVVQTENGNMKMRAEAPRMEKYEKDSLDYELFPEGFFVYGFDESGKLETEIVADNARHRKFKDGRESWEAFGNVVVKNLINQEVMETDTLYWDQKNEKIYTHPRAWQNLRHSRASPPECVPFQCEHLCPDHRRRQWRDSGFRQYAGEGI